MNIIIITQDDPFFLKQALKRLILGLPPGANIIACVVNKVSPFGKKENFLHKALKTYKIFGFYFFARYSLKYLKNKFIKTNSVKKLLNRHGIKIIELKSNINSEDSLNIIKKNNPDLLISIAGNEIFKKDLIEMAPKGCLNLHSALLPKYRGLLPTFWVLKNNEKYTGVSVFYVDEGIDSGPIIVQKRIEIGKMSQQELIIECKKVGIDALIIAIKKIMTNSVELIPNDDSEKTYFTFPSKQDVLDFKKSGARFF